MPECDHVFRYVDHVHNRTVSVTCEPSVCPQCLIRQVDELKTILSQVMAFGVCEVEDDEDEEFRTELLDRIDKVLAPAPLCPPE